MARAAQVRIGQVWEATVSGKRTKVQIVSEAPPKKPGGRQRFNYKNLSTGRMATGTAGKLKKLIQEAVAQPDGVPAVTAPASPAPLSKTRAAPVRRAKAPPGRTMPTQFEVSRGRQLAPRDDPDHPDFDPWVDDYYNNPPPPPARPLARDPLPSLRSRAPRPRRRTGARNPPSRVARGAADAVLASGAQTPQQVLRIIQRWAHEQAQRSGGFGFAGVSGPYGPYDNPQNPYGA
jgi:hypothetical protein